MTTELNITETRFRTHAQGVLSILITSLDTPLELVRRCLGSIVAQTRIDMVELVYVDDGSEEEIWRATKRELEELSGNIRSIVSARLSMNYGYPTARNVGLALAAGDWLLILDSDDHISPQLVETVGALADPGSTLLYSDHTVIHEDGSHYVREKSRYHALHRQHWNTAYDPLLSSTFLFHPQIFRRESLSRVGGFIRSPSGGEEVSAHLALTMNNPKALQHLPGSLYTYRPSAASITNGDDFYKFFIRGIELYLAQAAGLRRLPVSRAERVGRAKSTHAAHYRLFDHSGIPIDLPWFDYEVMDLRPE